MRPHDRAIFLFSDVIIFTKPRDPVTAQPQRYEFRHWFNFIKMRTVNLDDDQLHRNLVQLRNPNGLLISLSFTTVEETAVFIRRLSEAISTAQQLEAIHLGVFHEVLLQINLISN